MRLQDTDRIEIKATEDGLWVHLHGDTKEGAINLSELNCGPITKAAISEVFTALRSRARPIHCDACDVLFTTDGALGCEAEGCDTVLCGETICVDTHRDAHGQGARYAWDIRGH